MIDPSSESESTPDLSSAYALNSPEDAKRLYADWAATYDREFAEDMDFASPALIAGAFAEAGGAGPVLDFGCGTGLVGWHLGTLGVAPVDGLDISPEMLAVAAKKGAYRDLIEGNILDRLSLPEGIYSGITSSGTFTHGHVGPEAIDALLPLAAPGALFALSINAAHFESHGFAKKFDELTYRISDITLTEVRLYGPRSSGPHKDDKGLIALFRKR